MTGLNGCSWLSKKKQTSEPVVVVRTQLISCEQVPGVDALKLLPIEPFALITPEQKPLVGLTPKDYENLGRNMQSILQTMRQKNAVIEYYRECIEGTLEDERN